MNRLTRNRALAALGLALAIAACLSAPSQAIDEGPDPPPIPRTQPLSYYIDMVASLLPAFGSSMLSVSPGPDWMAGKTVHEVALAVGDDDPGTLVTDRLITVGYDEPDGPRYIKLDFGRGYIRYMNRDRSFQDSFPCTSIPESQALGMFQAVVSALSIPRDELGVINVSTVMERSVDGEDPNLPESVCEIERMITQARQLPNGYPVFDSRVRGSVSNLSSNARLLVEWPRFSLEGGLLMRDRGEVIDSLAGRIWRAVKNEDGLGPEIDLGITLGYARTAAGFVPVAQAGYTDIYDAEAGQILDVPLAANPTSGVIQPENKTKIHFRVRFEDGNGIAVMEFYLPRSERAQLLVFDVSGREIKKVADATYQMGWHQVQWDMRDDRNRGVAAGVYFATLKTEQSATSQRIILVR